MRNLAPGVVFGYRIEDQIKGHGIWRNFDGSWNPVFDKLTDGLSKNLPMEDNNLYRTDGRMWFAAAPSRETLKHWFSKKDAEELNRLGYMLYEFEIKDAVRVSDFEIVFTRDNISAQREIAINEIWGDES